MFFERINVRMESLTTVSVSFMSASSSSLVSIFAFCPNSFRASLTEITCSEAGIVDIVDTTVPFVGCLSRQTKNKLSCNYLCCLSDTTVVATSVGLYTFMRHESVATRREPQRLLYL